MPAALLLENSSRGGTCMAAFTRGAGSSSVFFPVDATLTMYINAEHGGGAAGQRLEALVREVGRNVALPAFPALTPAPAALPSASSPSSSSSSRAACTLCGNKDPRRFITDAENGDMICLGLTDKTGCGAVVRDQALHDGEEFRRFSEQADRNHHGPAPNPLMSTSHNLSTSLSLGPPAGSAGARRGSGGGDKALAREVARTARRQARNLLEAQAAMAAAEMGQTSAAVTVATEPGAAAPGAAAPEATATGATAGAIVGGVFHCF